MMSVKDSDTAAIKAGFENLWLLAILEDITKEIIDHLSFALALSALWSVNKPIMLAKSLPRFFDHLRAGPSNLPFRKSDQRDMLSAIETLEFAHNLTTEGNKEYQILRAIKNALSDFMEISIEYENSRVFSKARRTLEEVRKSSMTKYDKHDKTLPKLTHEIDRLRQDIQKELRKKKLRWKI